MNKRYLILTTAILLSVQIVFASGNDEYKYMGTGERLTMGQVNDTVSKYLKNYKGKDFTINEIMEFTENFYVEIGEKGSDILLQELLVNPWTGAISPEYGPNMMWNLSMPHMMMGAVNPEGTEPMTLSEQDAIKAADRYLNAVYPGTTADEDPDKFNGYYTMHVKKDDNVVGMLSVNGFTGQVWYHNWHGRFLGMTESRN